MMDSKIVCNYLCHGGYVFGCVCVYEHDSSKFSSSFFLILVKLCRGLAWARVNNPSKLSLHSPKSSSSVYWIVS